MFNNSVDQKEDVIHDCRNFNVSVVLFYENPWQEIGVFTLLRLYSAMSVLRLITNMPKTICYTK